MKPFKLTDIYPAMGDFKKESYKTVSLSKLSFLNTKDVQIGLAQYIESQKQTFYDVKFLYGGYLEKRNFYSGSSLFKNETENRNIHLGIDIWAPSGTPVFAAADGYIHGFAYNDKYLDYGGTIIVNYRDFFVLYGHLSKSSLLGLYPEKPINKSHKIAELGDINENGGWEPHLHIQVINDIGNYEGDYPGLCTEDKLKYYKSNCPDPEFLVTGQ